MKALSKGPDATTTPVLQALAQGGESEGSDLEPRCKEIQIARGWFRVFFWRLNSFWCSSWLVLRRGGGQCLGM